MLEINHSTSARIFAVGAVFMAVLAVLVGAAYASMNIAAKSGEPVVAKSYLRIDANGREWPVTYKFTSLPKNGTLRTQYTSTPMAMKDGQTKNVRVAQAVYQSKKGYVGEDSFRLIHVTGDPTDPYNNTELSYTVTVR